MTTLPGHNQNPPPLEYPITRQPLSDPHIADKRDSDYR